VPTRAMWKADLAVGRRSIPVKLYSAVQDQSVRFHLLDRRTKRRVRQRMVESGSGSEVEHEAARHGLEVEPGTLVILTDDELAEFEPEASREIEVLHFLPAGTIHHQWHERPYYLGPDGDAESYHALARALANKKREGFAKWVMRGRRYFGNLRSEGHVLALISLRNADEVLLPKELPAPSGRASTKKELEMADRLISMLAGPFRPEEFHDEYTEKLQAFLGARARGRRPKLKAVPTKRAAGASIERELERSLEAMEKSSGSQKKAA
jgi:DNA end-binding protein Ku